MDISTYLVGLATSPMVLALFPWLRDQTASALIQNGVPWAGKKLLRVRWGRMKVFVGWERFYQAYPLNEQFQTSKEVWLAWLAGRTGLQPHNSPAATHRTKVTRLILPQQGNPSVATLSKIEGVDVTGDVVQGERRAHELGIPIRLYPGVWGCEVTIGFYKKPAETSKHHSGWAHVCAHFPGVPDTERLFYRITSKANQANFDALVGATNKMWNESRPSDTAPPKEVKLYDHGDGYLHSEPSASKHIKRSTPDTGAPPSKAGDS